MIPPIKAQLLYIGFDCQINLKSYSIEKEIDGFCFCYLLSFSIDYIQNQTDNGKKKT